MTLARDKTHALKAHDAYMTIDPRPIPALLKCIRLRGLVWEPAAGTCEIVRRLRALGYKVLATDLFDYECQTDALGNFLAFDRAPMGSIQSIVTNPPNELNIEFALHALKMTQPVAGVVAFYQRHEWDTTKESAAIFDHSAFAMKITCRFRPKWIAGSNGSPFHRWSWYVWDWQHTGPALQRYA